MNGRPMTASNAPRTKWEYRIQWRRRGWQQRNARLYQSMPPVRRFVDKLHRWRDDLEPVVEIFVQRRAVGEWESVRRPGDDDERSTR